MNIKLLLILILIPISAYTQDSIKIKSKICMYVKIWPDTNKIIGRWYAEQRNGILLSIPSIEKDKRIKIIEYHLKEKNGNALITKDSVVRNAFWVYPFSSTSSDGRQPPLKLELWIKLNKRNIFYPVSKNGGEVFDKTGKVILKNIKWQELRKTTEFKDGLYLIGSLTFAVNGKK